MMGSGTIMRIISLMIVVTYCCHCTADSQNAEAVVSQEEAEATVEPIVDEIPKPVKTSNNNNNSSQDEALGQSLLTQLTQARTGVPPIDIFTSVFPALGSLLLWGSQFPTQKLLQSTADNQAAASKVVLVLADDANKSAQAKVRLSRADTPPSTAPPNMFSQIIPDPGQLLGQFLSPNVGQSLSSENSNPTDLLGQFLPPAVGQSLTSENFNPSQILGQVLSPNVGQSLIPENFNPSHLLGQALSPHIGPSSFGDNLNFGQFLSPLVGQSLPGALNIGHLLPTGLNLGQLPFLNTNILGQSHSTASASDSHASSSDANADSGAGTSADSSAGAKTDASSNAHTTSSATSSGTNGPSLLPSLLGPAFSGQLLGQSLDGGSLLSQALSNLPQPGNLFSQALGQTSSASGASGGSGGSGTNIFLSQALRQAPSGILGQALNLTPQLSQLFGQTAQPAEDSAAQASDISEVRVKPDSKFMNPNEDSLMTARSEANDTKSIPLLWFRQPAQEKLDEHTVDEYRKTHQQHSKSLEELKIEAKLQAFERQVIAELKLLQEIERLAKEMRSNAKTTAVNMHKDSQTLSPFKLSYPLSKTPLHKITRDDVERALRDDYVRKLLQKQVQLKGKTQPLGNSDISSTIKRQTMTTDRQISKDELVKMLAYAYRMATENSGTLAPSLLDADAIKANQQKIYAAYRTNQGSMAPTANNAERQWMDNQQTNQWSGDMTMQQQQQQQRQLADNQQQIQWSEDMARQQQQRQWADDMAKQQQQRQWTEEMAQQQQQRQWADAEAAKQQQQQKFQWAEEIARQQQLAQWADEADKSTQREWSDNTQTTTTNMETPQQMHTNMQDEDERKWTDEKMNKMREMTLRQWADDQKMKTESSAAQWADQKVKDNMPQQERQLIDEKQTLPMPNTQEIKSQWVEQPNAEQGSLITQRHFMDTQSQPMSNLNTAQAMRQWNEAPSTSLPATQQQIEMTMQQPGMIMDPIMTAQRDMQDPIMMVAETPQMPENTDKARVKVASWDILGIGKDKRKKGTRPMQSVVNYYYGGNNYERPYGAGGGSGSGVYQQSAAPLYSTSSFSSTYGGGGAGSNAYGVPAGAYRAAVGSDEIDAMIREHQIGPKITVADIQQFSESDSEEKEIAEEKKVDHIKHPITLQLEPISLPTKTEKSTQKSILSQPSLASILTSTSASASKSKSTSTSASALKSTPTSLSGNNSAKHDPEFVGSIWSFDQYLLEPYMGLMSIDHYDDPWHYKSYNLHQPIYTGGGSYEPYLHANRKRRDIRFLPRTNLLTPEMLAQLLRIKMELQRTFPQLYSLILEQNKKSTRITVKPPIIPTAVDYPIVELAAAEINPEDLLLSKNNELNKTQIPTQETTKTHNKKKSTKIDDDDAIDYFHFDDDE